jgi:hypothetical protein
LPGYLAVLHGGIEREITAFHTFTKIYGVLLAFRKEIFVISFTPGRAKSREIAFKIITTVNGQSGNKRGGQKNLERIKRGLRIDTGSRTRSGEDFTT